MDYKRIILMFCTALLLFTGVDARTRQKLDFDWQFRLQSDLNWTNVKLPHDWSTTFNFDKSKGGANGYLAGGVGEYRKTLEIPSSWKGKRISLVFDGVYHQAHVKVNDKELALHRYGYTPFEVDLTDVAKYGEDNVINVTVDRKENSRWYTGSGIYRHVWLLVTDQAYVSENGTYITTQKKHGSQWNIHVTSTVNLPENTSYEVVLFLKGKNKKIEMADTVLQGKGQKDVAQQFSLQNPRIWDIDHPKMYTLYTEIRKNNKVLDSYESHFGCREIAFDANSGFSLNGRKVRLQGVCLHQDDGCLGVAVPDRSVVRRLQILKRFGINAVRCSHNPYSNEFLNTCDSLGLVVIDEAFDKWTSGYYGKWYNECWRQDMADMIRRDRNHPSIILWSIGNETDESRMSTDEGAVMANTMQIFVHRIEPTRKVMTTLPVGFKQKFASVVDVAGYNYLEPQMIVDHKKYPQRIFITTEAFPYYSSSIPGIVRDYIARNPWNFVIENDFISGEFIWPGVDYFGESTDWPSKGFPCGIFDVCMNPKPRADYFASVWNNKPYIGIYALDYSLNEDPGKDCWQAPGMIHDWTFPQYGDGRILRIETPTNCDTVTLIDCSKNRTYTPRYTRNYTNGTVVWNQPYSPGKLIAVGYKNGKIVCRDSIQTSGYKATGYKVSVDRSVINADGQDVAYISLQLTDIIGLPVQIDDRRVTVTVSGEGRLLGINSGEMRRSDPLCSNTLPTYRGFAQILVQSNRKAGNIVVSIHVDSLTESSISLLSVKVPSHDYTMAINAIHTASSWKYNEYAYNLSGQRVNKSTRGILIVAGRKFINK